MALGSVQAGYGNVEYSSSQAKCQSKFSERIQEILDKLQNGETEEKYQIGGQSFSVNEWKEFLEKFDSVQDAIREAMRERHEKQNMEQEEREELLKDITEDPQEVSETDIEKILEDDESILEQILQEEQEIVD